MPVSTFKIIAWILFAALGGLTLWAATQITGAAFDPLGSQAVPYALGSLLLLLMVVDAGVKKQTQTESEEPADWMSMIRMAAVLGLSVLYCAGVFILAIPFSIATLVFIPLASYVLSPSYDRRANMMRLVIGAVIGCGGEFLFTKVFFVDIPGLW